MGSSVETSIVFTTVMLILVFLITGSQDMTLEGLAKAKTGIKEIAYMEENKDIYSTKTIAGVNAVNTSPEQMCTLLSGLSDNFRIIYDAVGGL